MRRLAALALALALVAAAPARAAEPRASLPDLEDEVMCVECGTALGLSNAPVAERQRAFIRREIGRGRTKEQIKAALVERFGPSVLAMPEDRGFGRAAYVVPALALLGAALLVGLAARGWRRGARPVAPAPPVEGAEANRLERELRAYDG